MAWRLTKNSWHGAARDSFQSLWNIAGVENNLGEEHLFYRPGPKGISSSDRERWKYSASAIYEYDTRVLVSSWITLAKNHSTDSNLPDSVLQLQMRVCYAIDGGCSIGTPYRTVIVFESNGENLTSTDLNPSAVMRKHIELIESLPSFKIYGWSETTLDVLQVLRETDLLMRFDSRGLAEVLTECLFACVEEGEQLGDPPMTVTKGIRHAHWIDEFDSRELRRAQGSFPGVTF